MEQNYLEVTFRGGQALMAYCRLPRRQGDKSVRTRQVEPQLIVDFAEDGRAIGIEILAPKALTIEVMNRLLAELGQKPMKPEELAPLHAV